jgi:hypothetical protein
MPGPAIASLDVADPPEAWEALGLAVDDDGSCRIGATVLRLGAEGSGIVGWTLRDGAGTGPVDGLPTQRTTAPPPPAAEHPIGARAVDHVVISTPDVDRTFAALQATGMTLRRERTAGAPGRPLRQGFFRHGEAIVEVVGPAEAAGDGPATFWGLVVVVADMDRAAELVGDRLGEPRDAVQPGRRIATVGEDAGLSVALALMTTA